MSSTDSEAMPVGESPTADIDLKHTVTLQKLQSNIIPAPQYYRWERQCDECGRVFAYLDVHLSKSKLCRAAYDVKELRERLRRADQAAVSGGTRSQECQERSIGAEEEAALRAAASSMGAHSGEPDDDEGVMTASQVTTFPKIEKNRNAPTKMSRKGGASRAMKHEALSSTTDQLMAIQRKLHEFHERLNKCEVMSKRRRRVEVAGNRLESEVAFSALPSDDSGFLCSPKPSILLEDVTANRVAGFRSRCRNGMRAARRQPQVLLEDSFSDDDDGDLEILDENYLLSAQSRRQKPTPVHKAYIQKTVCRHCGARMKYILSHLSKSFRCQVAYDMTHLRQQAEHNKKIRQKYYLKHLKRKRKRPEVFEIVEQVGSRGDRRSVASNFSLQRRGRGQGSHFVSVGRRVQLDATGRHEVYKLSGDALEDKFTRLPNCVPQVTPLAGSGSATRRLFSETCHVTASGPASCDVSPASYEDDPASSEDDPAPFDSDYPCFDSSSSHSEDDLEPLNTISAHVVDGNLFTSHFSGTASRVGGCASPEDGHWNTHIKGESVTAAPGSSLEQQSITRLKRPASGVIKLTKAGKTGGREAGHASAKWTP